jgi:hypothetical protein
MNEKELIEALAEVEHKQWMLWAKEVFNEVSPERQKRWESYFIEYKNLPEEVKEQDRVFARKALEIIKK